MLALMLTILLVSAAAVLLVTFIALNRFLVNRLDQQLKAAGLTYAQSLEHPDEDSDDHGGLDTAGQARGTLGARSIDGKVTASGVVSSGSQSDPYWRPIWPCSAG